MFTTFGSKSLLVNLLRNMLRITFLWKFHRIYQNLVDIFSGYSPEKFLGIGYEKFLGMGFLKYIRMGYEKFLGMGYKKFLGMGYEKFLRIAVKISTDFPEKDSWKFPWIPGKDS